MGCTLGVIGLYAGATGGGADGTKLGGEMEPGGGAEKANVVMDGGGGDDCVCCGGDGEEEEEEDDDDDRRGGFKVMAIRSVRVGARAGGGE